MSLFKRAWDVAGFLGASQVLFYTMLLFFPWAVLPGIRDPYTTPKEWMLSGVLGLIFIHCAIFKKQWIFPRLEWRVWLLFWIGSGWVLFQALTKTPHSSGVILQDRVIFLGWTGIGALALQKRSLDFWRTTARLVSLTSIGVACLGLFQIATVIPTDNVPYFEIASTFGHSNLTAQYLALAWIASNLGMYLDRSRSLLKALHRTAGILALAYIALAMCRSVIVGVLIAMGIALWRKIGVRRFEFVLQIWIALMIVGTVQWIRPPVSDLNLSAWKSEKNANRLYRSEMWGEAYKMIQEHPLGIGFGRFQYIYPIYKIDGKIIPEEGLLEKSPHNEILRILIEGGWIYFLFVLGLVGVFVRWSWVLSGKEQSWIMMFGVIFGCEMIFQFPLENPAPLLALSVVVAHLMVRAAAQKSTSLFFRVNGGGWVRGVAFGLGSVFMFWTMASVLASAVEARWIQEPRWVDLACKVHPVAPWVCRMSAQNWTEEGRFDEAVKILERRRVDFPLDLISLPLLGRSQVQSGNVVRGCYYFWVYHQILSEKSSVFGEMMESCSNEVLSGFNFDETVLFFRKNLKLPNP